MRLKKLRRPDLNRRPSGNEPDELPGCSTPRKAALTRCRLTGAFALSPAGEAPSQNFHPTLVLYQKWHPRVNNFRTESDNAGTRAHHPLDLLSIATGCRAECTFAPHLSSHGAWLQRGLTIVLYQFRTERVKGSHLTGRRNIRGGVFGAINPLGTGNF